MTQTVLILGASGKIGSHAARAFADAGWQVRLFNRETDDMTLAAQGCDVIVNGLNPPNYHDWDTLVPRITRDVIAAAQGSGATVVLPSNIYNFGQHEGQIDRTTPQRAETRKGRIRIAMETAYREAGVPTIVLRAGHFITPDGNGDIMELMLLREARKRRITSAGDPTVRQAYAFVPDWARAAVMLAERRDNLPTFADIPFPGHTFSAEDLRTRIAAATGQDWRVTRFPWWLMTVLAPFWELAREFREMRYIYDMDHWIGGETFAAALPDFHPTPLTKVMLAGLPGHIHPDEAMRSGQQTVLAE